MDSVVSILKEIIFFFNEIAVYLLFGFLIAGLLHVFFPDSFVKKHLGKGNWKNVFKGALFGLPLPLCSCGVVPVAASLRKSGASKGSVVSFLITTPQVGADSFMITYSLLGWVFAVFRILASLLTALIAGIFINLAEKEKKSPAPKFIDYVPLEENALQRLKKIASYIEYELMGSIVNTLLLGIVIAGLINAILPENFLSTYLGSEFLSMLLMLAVGIPVYVCASASTPIAASLVLKGLSPGAALVFLLSGPATNAANLSMVTKIIGKKGTAIYLAAIATGSLAVGYLFNLLVQSAGMSNVVMTHVHDVLPRWLHLLGAVVLGAMIVWYYIRLNLDVAKKEELEEVQKLSLKVEGMSCPHCTASVKTAVESVEGTSGVTVYLKEERVDFQIESAERLAQVKERISAAGYVVE